MDGRRPVLRPWIRSADARRERRYKNGNTSTSQADYDESKTNKG